MFVRQPSVDIFRVGDISIQHIRHFNLVTVPCSNCTIICIKMSFAIDPSPHSNHRRMPSSSIAFDDHQHLYQWNASIQDLKSVETRVLMTICTPLQLLVLLGVLINHPSAGKAVQFVALRVLVVLTCIIHVSMSLSNRPCCSQHCYSSICACKEGTSAFVLVESVIGRRWMDISGGLFVTFSWMNVLIQSATGSPP